MTITAYHLVGVFFLLFLSATFIFLSVHAFNIRGKVHFYFIHYALNFYTYFSIPL